MTSIKRKSIVEVYFYIRGDYIFSSILNYIYPPTCGVCGKLDSHFLCHKCEILLKKHSVFQTDFYQDSEIFFQEHSYLFPYEGMIRNLILNYKFQEKPYLYFSFVNFLLKNEKIFAILESYDIIIPVPISPKRKKQRGYNQSSLIAKEIGKKTNLTYVPNVLKKSKEIVKQSELNKEQRKENIKDAYEIQNGVILKQKKILLFDDVFTTGSTANECSRIIKQYDPNKVGVITLAKD